MVADSQRPPEQAQRPALSEDTSHVSEHLRQARAQLLLYFSAQAARIKVMLRTVALYGAFGIAAAFITLSIIITSAVLFCVGLADAISQLLGGRQWAGDLIVGGGVLATILVGMWLVVTRITKAASKQTIASFEKRKRH